MKGERRLPFPRVMPRPASERAGRPWLTAKGYRAIGYEIPDELAADDEVLVFVPVGDG